MYLVIGGYNKKGDFIMNFNHLEYAVAVAKAGSIRKASQNLYMSQPYLSGMIKGLEDELGYRIFNRTAAGVTLTNEGEDFLRCAKVILLELRKLKDVNKDQDGRALNLSTYYATYIMDRFLKFHNASSYKFSDQIKEMGNEDVMESVSSGDSTVGIVFFAKEKLKKYERLWTQYDLLAEELLPPMEIYAMLHRTHPLADLDSMKVANLSDYPYVTYNDSSSHGYLDLLGIKDHPGLLAVSDRGSFYDALRSGEYLTSMAYRKPVTEGEFLTLPFRDKKVFLCSRYVIARNYHMSKREKEFIHFIQQSSVLNKADKKKTRT